MTNPEPPTTQPATGLKSEAEEWYDREISPKIIELVKALAERGLSSVIKTEFEPGKSALSCHLEKNCGPEMRLAYYGAMCNGNADTFINALIKDAKVLGHNSAYLMRYVPCTPVGK